MRFSKRGFLWVLLTTAVFLLTYTYVSHTNEANRIVDDLQMMTKLTDDSRKLPPIDLEGAQEQQTLKLDAKNEKPSVQTKTRKPSLTTPLPKTGLANSSLIGSFNASLSYVIPLPLKCSPENGRNLDLLIVVITAFSKRVARDTIRQTWGAHALKRGAQLIFLIGKSSKTKEANAIIQESEEFRDIVQQNLEDDYYNMTLKTVGMVKWTYEYCRNAKFVFKVDDDMFVNSELLLVFAKSNLNLRKTIIGSLWPGGQPIRKHGKWYVPMSLYPYPYYPTYVSGGAYLITGDSVPLLYETSLVVPTFIFEDVLMAGMVAKKAGVKRLHAEQISVNRFELEDICKFRDHICAHNYNPKMVIDLWERLNRRDIECPSSNKTIL